MSQCNRSGTVTQISELTEVAGNAKLHLCYCARCGPSDVNIKWSSNLTFSWAVHLFCNICHVIGQYAPSVLICVRNYLITKSVDMIF